MTQILDMPVVDSLKKYLDGAPKQLLIGGQWTDALSGRTFETHDPASGQKIADVAHATAEDVDRAVAAARLAFEGPWSKFTPTQRQRAIWKIGDAILEHAQELGQLECLDNGKSAVIAEAVDVTWSADLFHYYAGWATKIEGRTIPVSVPWVPGAEWHAYTLREPLGVCGQIIPWNFPLLMAAFKIPAALAAGNTVVLKPAEQTPLTALLLGEIITELDVLPPGVVNIVPGYGDAGAAIAAHDDVDKVAFTGSTEVGKLIVDAAKGNLKKVSLELGGKSPQVVFADADLEVAIPGSASGWLFNHGQTCTAGTRVLVEDSIFDEFTERTAEFASQAKIGPGIDPTTQVGPLVSAEQLDRVTGYLRQGLADGARALTGGSRVGDSGYYVAPTVLVDVNRDMSVYQEEIFGPVVVAMPFNASEGVQADANDSIYGLAAGVWTKDISKAHRVAKQLKAGTVWVNTYNAFDTALPFGGYKQSGWGRELGAGAIELYTQIKAVNVQL